MPIWHLTPLIHFWPSAPLPMLQAIACFRLPLSYSPHFRNPQSIVHRRPFPRPYPSTAQSISPLIAPSWLPLVNQSMVLMPIALRSTTAVTIKSLAQSLFQEIARRLNQARCSMIRNIPRQLPCQSLTLLAIVWPQITAGHLKPRRLQHRRIQQHPSYRS